MQSALTHTLQFSSHPLLLHSICTEERITKSTCDELTKLRMDEQISWVKRYIENYALKKKERLREIRSIYINESLIFRAMSLFCELVFVYALCFFYLARIASVLAVFFFFRMYIYVARYNFYSFFFVSLCAWEVCIRPVCKTFLIFVSLLAFRFFFV